MEVFFTEVKLDSSKNILFARAGSTPVFALPGRPTAVEAGFDQFILLAILKMKGEDSGQ